MKPITARSLDWIDTAPVRVTKTKVINAPVAQVWTVIADHEGWPAWFGPVRRVEPLDPPEGVGGGRRVHLGGGAGAEEEFLAWDPEERFAFTLTHVNRMPVKSMVEDIQLTENGEGTTVTYTQALEPTGPAVLGKVVGTALGAGLKRGLDGLAKHVEGQ